MKQLEQGPARIEAGGAVDRLARLPQALYGLLLAGYLGYVLTQAGVHGRSFDEPLQNEYGHRVLHWYTSLGSDTSFLSFPVKQQMPQHGPFFETIVAAAQSLGGHLLGANEWTVRSLVCGLVGLLGIVLIGLCGRAIGGWWTGFAAALGLALYPRYSGAIFNNSKDIPLAVAMLLVLWLALVLIRRWTTSDGLPVRWCVALGVALGAATSIRINALVLVGVLGIVGLAWLLRHGGASLSRAEFPDELRRLVGATVITGIATYLTILATWPYILLHPVGGLPDAYASMSRYQWSYKILYDGKMIGAMHLPRSYALKWLWLGSPYPTFLLALAGVVLAVVVLLRRDRPLEHRGVVLAVLLAFLLPLAAIVLDRPTLYNGLRHFLFLIPPLVLLAAWALTSGIAWAARRTHVAVVVVAVLAVLATQVQVVLQVAKLYPYEYMYFTAFGGGFAGHEARYETDYWGQCNHAAMLWLRTHWRDYDHTATATVGGRWVPPGVLEPDAGDGLKVVGTARVLKADFGIYSLRNWRRDPFPANYRTIHDVTANGDVLCQVLAR